MKKNLLKRRITTNKYCPFDKQNRRCGDWCPLCVTNEFTEFVTIYCGTEKIQVSDIIVYNELNSDEEEKNEKRKQEKIQ